MQLLSSYTGPLETILALSPRCCEQTCQYLLLLPLFSIVCAYKIGAADVLHPPGTQNT